MIKLMRCPSIAAAVAAAACGGCCGTLTPGASILGARGGTHCRVVVMIVDILVHDD